MEIIDNIFTVDGEHVDVATVLELLEAQKEYIEEHAVAGADGIDGLDGTNGVDGVDGLSAYELALQNGFVGTKQEWLTSLQGQDGQDGQDGASVANEVSTTHDGNTLTNVEQTVQADMNELDSKKLNIFAGNSSNGATDLWLASGTNTSTYGSSPVNLSTNIIPSTTALPYGALVYKSKVGGGYEVARMSRATTGTSITNSVVFFDSGTISSNVNPTIVHHLTRKGYVDTQDALLIPKTDITTTISGTPSDTKVASESAVASALASASGLTLSDNLNSPSSAVGLSTEGVNTLLARKMIKTSIETQLDDTITSCVFDDSGGNTLEGRYFILEFSDIDDVGIGANHKLNSVFFTMRTNQIVPYMSVNFSSASPLTYTTSNYLLQLVLSNNTGTNDRLTISNTVKSATTDRPSVYIRNLWEVIN